MTNQEGYDVVKVKEGDQPFDFEYQDSKGEKFKLSELLKQAISHVSATCRDALKQ